MVIYMGDWRNIGLIRFGLFLLLLAVSLMLGACNYTSSESPISADPPYPPSKVIESVVWDQKTHRHFAPGSDNWPMTWADDDQIYTAWGDGGGFGGTNKDGRVSLGIARIIGDPDNYHGINLWGGKNGENPAQFKGKSYGLLSVDGLLYMAFFSQENVEPYKEGQFAVSSDRGATFRRGFKFKEPDAAFAVCTFLNFGKDYSGARDNYVYVYAGQPLDNCVHRCIGKDVFLARVKKTKIMESEFYEFFSGMDAGGEPHWSNKIADRTPVFTDRNGAGVRLGVIYNPGLKRYLMTISHNNRGGLGIFDAPEPWGPWTTVAYYDEWLFGYSPSYHIAPQKWMSADGTSFVLVWSSKDRLNTIRGRLKLRK
jgi:hypothetical protein